MNQGRRKPPSIRARVADLLASTDLSMRVIAARLGCSGAWVGQINREQGYIRAGNAARRDRGMGDSHAR